MNYLGTFIVLVATTSLIGMILVIDILSDQVVSYRTISTELQHDLSDTSTSLIEHQQALQRYTVTEEYLYALGASEAQALAVIKASEVYSLNPKY